MGNSFDFMDPDLPEFEAEPCATCGGQVPVGAPDTRCRYHIPQEA